MKTLSRTNPNVKVQTIIADSGDLPSLNAMVSRSKVVISTVGPYALYGLKLVEACVNNKTDYVDLTGEPHFIREIIDKFHDKAVKNDVLIVPSCGFDSIPSDLGALLIANEFKAKGKETNSIRYALQGSKGGVSGGTVASGIAMVSTLSLKSMYEMSANPEYLNPDVKPSKSTWTSTSVTYDKTLKQWLGPFVMETTNLKYVRRSNFLLGYGDEFQYREGVAFSNFIYASLMLFAVTVGTFMIVFPPTRWFLGYMIPPGQGPSEKTRRTGYFTVHLVGDSVKVHLR
jgi:short subunit dehydrogenase-like uncharacterized protein